MLRDFTQGQWKEEIEYSLCFDDGAYNGLGFPCDENGNLPSDLNPAARENYNRAMKHPEKYVRFNKVVQKRRHFREPASGICECGQRIELWDQYLGACECPVCGRWYNLFGQELNPPDTWSEGDDW